MPKQKKPIVDKPEPGKNYSLTGAPGVKCIANGNSWKDSEFIEPKPKKNPLDDMSEKQIKEAMEAATGLSRDDFSDDGADLIEFQELSELN